MDPFFLLKPTNSPLSLGTTVDQCFELMAQASARFPFKLLMMGYYNTVFKMGEDVFVQRLKEVWWCGLYPSRSTH